MGSHIRLNKRKVDLKKQRRDHRRAYKKNKAIVASSRQQEWAEAQMVDDQETSTGNENNLKSVALVRRSDRLLTKGGAAVSHLPITLTRKRMTNPHANVRLSGKKARLLVKKQRVQKKEEVSREHGEDVAMRCGAFAASTTEFGQEADMVVDGEGEKKKGRIRRGGGDVAEVVPSLAEEEEQRVRLLRGSSGTHIGMPVVA
eukprot:Nk52_evm6s2355 gene=Nk52_evmTU6s2355